MARYRDSVCKLCRREATKLFLKGDRCLSEKCAFERRPFPPGQHGRRQRKPSEYQVQLREKQKTKRIYGILERQFRNYYELAVRQKGITGENLLRILETRMDNVVYRLGLATSRAEARQLVRHGQFAVNGRRVTIPSLRVRPGDGITVSDRGAKVERIKYLASAGRVEVPGWMSLDAKKLSATVLESPAREQIDASVREQLIVELYSK